MSALRKMVLLFIALLFFAVPAAFAYDIVVDGDPSDWFGSSIRFVDANEAAILDSVDFESVSSTVSTDQSTLYLKFETYAPTSWLPNGIGGKTPQADKRVDVCLDLDNNASTGATVGQCNAAIGSEVWIQFAGQPSGSPVGYAQYCTGPTTANCVYMPMQYAAAGTTLEIGIDYADMNFACTETPSDFLLAAVFDGASVDPDDYLPAQGQATSIPNNCQDPNSVDPLFFSAEPNYTVRTPGAHIDTEWVVLESQGTVSWTLYRHEKGITTTVGTVYSNGAGGQSTYTMRDTDLDGILRNVTYTLVETESTGATENYGPYGPYTYGN
ncbi:MAG: hypothetical protein KDJ52_28465 [Anaerolineae bacterium]|nr:hypothetical protein [Anaerolineae bacterium]